MIRKKKKKLKRKWHLVKPKKEEEEEEKEQNTLQYWPNQKYKRERKETIYTWEREVVLSFDYNYISPLTPLFSP